MHPELLHIGIITIHTYGIAILIGFLVAIYIIYSKAKKNNLNPKFIYDHIMTLILIPLLISRIFHVIVNWKIYRTNIPGIFYFWQGGYSFWVTIIGIIGITWLLTARYNQSFQHWLDQISVALFVFFAFSFLGFSMSQYGLSGIAVGIPTNLPFGVTINIMNSPYAGVAVHPVLLYQALLALTIGFIGIFHSFKPAYFWSIGWFLFALFGFIIEFMKFEQRYEFFTINGNQILTLIIMIICITNLIIVAKTKTVESHQ